MNPKINLKITKGGFIRLYLGLITLFFSIFLMSFTGFEGYNSKLALNPSYKIKRMSTGVVIAYSNQNGKIIQHEFKEIYADVVLAAYRKQSVNQIIPVLAKKYYFDENECRREVKHAINTLTEWAIIVSASTN